nr:AMMECR1 domain-containing protein [Nannocystis sp.]
MVALVPPAPALEPIADLTRHWLLFVARRALRTAMAQRAPGAIDLPIGTAERPDDPRLDAPARVFVSWYDRGEQVGCLGSLEPWLSLEQAVARYAVHAGLDPRMPAARASRWHRLIGEISVLGEAQDLPVTGLAQIAEVLVPNRDGVTLAAGPRQQVVSLPSAWRSSPRPRDFLINLMRTAGLSPEHDGPRLRGRTFLAETFLEPIAAITHSPSLTPALELQIGA